MKHAEPAPATVFHVKHPPSAALPSNTLKRLSVFADLIKRWSPHIRLVAPGDLPVLWARHVEDSLQLLPLIPVGTTHAIDLGSGAGFPGLVLAIAGDLPFDLIESDQRKAAFLREAARETAAPVTIHAVRAEAARLPSAPLITARALAPLPRLLHLAAPLLASGGACLFPKGARTDTEIAEAASAWRFHVERHPSRTHPEGQILRITELTHV